MIYDCLINLIDYWEDHLSKLLILITIILETNKKIPDWEFVLLILSSDIVEIKKSN